jgi:hypothetical protein
MTKRAPPSEQQQMTRNRKNRSSWEGRREPITGYLDGWDDPPNWQGRKTPFVPSKKKTTVDTNDDDDDDDDRKQQRVETPPPSSWQGRKMSFARDPNYQQSTHWQGRNAPFVYDRNLDDDKLKRVRFAEADVASTPPNTVRGRNGGMHLLSERKSSSSGKCC